MSTKSKEKSQKTLQSGTWGHFFYSLWTNKKYILLNNLLFVITNIPMMAIAFLYCIFFLPMMSENLAPEAFSNYLIANEIISNESMNGNPLEAANQLYYFLLTIIIMFLVSSCLLCIGPVESGLCQVFRNIYRGQGVEYKNDLKKGIKSNIPQTIGAMIISGAVLAIILYGISFYLKIEGNVGTIGSTILLILLFVFVLIQNMVYQLIVSIDLPLLKIYKDALLFFLLKFGKSLIMIIIMIIVLLIVPYILLLSSTFITLTLLLLLYLFVISGLLQFMFSYFTSDYINAYIVKKQAENNSLEGLQEENNTQDKEVQDEQNEEEEQIESDSKSL